MKFFKAVKKCVCSLSAFAVFAGAVPVSYSDSSDVSFEAVDGTTGTPLGGFGAGAVKFNAMKGNFAAITKAPADQNDYAVVGNSRFQFYSNAGGKIETADTLTAVKTDGRYDDDAVWPEHMVNFGTINGIDIAMTAFSPLDSENYDNMSMPYAFYEMTLTNTNSAQAEAAAALLWDISSGSAEYVAGKGFTSQKWAVFAESGSAVPTVGSGNDFFTTGECSNATSGVENRTAVKVTLEPNETAKIKFVVAWYDNSDHEGAYYLSKYTNAADIAQLGLNNFDRLKNNADTLVNKMRASDIPDWYMNQCLNSLANISNNSIYKTDGRTAFAEGEWTCFGTMDQMWHARQIIGNLIPQFAWQELEYWARTQRSDGQIHHDFNYMTDTSVKYKLVPWDDTEHADYRKVDKWVDLNCGFIISIYETYQQTGNEEKLSYFWPYMKKAGQRIFDQVTLYGDSDYPYTFKISENSYDAGGDPNAFNTSVSAVAYKIMKILCDKMNETELAAKYQTAYDTVVESYRQKYLTDNFPVGRISESYFAGQWLAMHLKLGQIWTQAETDYVIDCLDGYYHPLYKMLGYSDGTYDEWTPYLLAHYGGLLLNTRRQNQYEALQKDSYNRQFKNRNYVFNHPLDILPSVATANYTADNISGDKQYISIPTIWRNYYDVIGYHRDAASKELWLEPHILTEMNHTMTNAAYISPDGYGTISCTETASEGSEAYQNKNITFKPDNNIYVGTLYLEDNFGADTNSISVTINGTSYPFERIGDGYTKELAVAYNATVTSSGINVVTSGDAGAEPPADPEKPADIDVPPVTAEMSAFTPIEAEKYSGFGGISVAEENGVKYITECDDQDYVKYDGIGFEDGAKSITLTVRSNKQSHIELALGLVSGETVQNIEIPDTNGEWQTITCQLNEVISGTQNVIFRFRTNNDESADLVDIDSFVFDYRYQIPISGWTASASYNSSAASSAFDRDTATRWNSSYQTGSEWYLLDMGTVYSFNKIKINSSKDYPRKYAVYVSQDGVNFSESVASGQGANGEMEITFERQNARYIKICQTGTASSNYWSMYELYVYNMDEDFLDGNQTPAPTLPPDPTVNKYTYAGTSDNHPNGTGYFDVTKYNNGTKNARSNSDDNIYTFADGLSDEIKAQFADSSDSTKISGSYTNSMVNYIGYGQDGEYNIKPAITGIELPKGEYTLYYIGGNSNDIEITFENDTNNTVTVTPVSKYSFATSKLILHEAKVTLTEAYTGDITFYNSTKWLPDLYAVKLVPEGGTIEETPTPTATAVPEASPSPEPIASTEPTSSPEPIASTEPTLLPAEGIVISVSKKDISHAQASVNNNTADVITVQFITAVYNPDGSLHQVILADKLSVIENGASSVTLDIPSDTNYKIMAWDGIDTMKPICRPFSGADIQ